MEIRKKLKQTVLFFILGSLVFTSAGCAVVVVGAAAAAGAGTVAFIKGSMVQNLDKSVSQVHTATLTALRDLKAVVKEDDFKNHKVFIKALIDENQGVTIYIEALTELSSKIKVRVGLFGDEMKSQKILNAISHRL